ncbi:hypothetical protein C8A03DRAFT_36097 [Achaetomium macrosporum]|uniref:Uncharacterized protein n=1 Tax=Achaetomium macrosporum TaxID=79813 RepID=A0AAN7C6U1_9PEZI|nr:hypothetical protein C8A03DRAFT_36097 [Achaetomium macrosporum]
MVSFFGLRFGDKKKKSDGKPAPGKPQPIDQDTLGEGQFFGQNINQKGAVNGSIRSVSRAGTPMQGGSGKPPYAHADTHNLAAASMHNLSTLRPGHRGSQTSLHLKLHASDVNLRTRFGTNNGSSTSLAAPAPGFGARFGANNASSPVLAAPGPGFGSRPGTPNRTKPWVNPLDVHFARSLPSGPPTPRSPLIGSPQLPPTPTTDNGETGSVFGEEADEMVDAVMASVKKREDEAKRAKERERELEKQRETARLEMERLERQKSTESNLSGRRPSAPQIQGELQQTGAEAPSLPDPLSRGDDARPGSRNGPTSPLRPSPLHQGPPATGPPTHCLPQPPGQSSPRYGPLGLAGEGPSGRAPRSVGTIPSGPGTGLGTRPHTAGSHIPRPPYADLLTNPHRAGSEGSKCEGPPQKVFKPYRPPPLQGTSPLGPLPDDVRSASPPLSTPGIEDHGSRASVLIRSASKEHRPAMFHPEPPRPAADGRNTPGPERQGLGPLLSSLTSPSTATSPSGSIRRLSLDDEPTEQLPRPIIRNVQAMGDTLTLSSYRQQSLSMKIEELEKTLVTVQQAHQGQTPQIQDANRSSTGSSVYSEGFKEEDEDDDGPILSIHPAPLRIPSPISIPPVSPMSPPAVASPTVNRPQSPLQGLPRRGPLPRRLGLEEYGVSSNKVTRGGTPTPGSRSGSTDNYSSHSSPPSRTNTPQLRHRNWRRDLGQPSPAPTVDTSSERFRPNNPVVDTGFNFDFGPSSGAGAPPTPDSTTWPLASPTIAEKGSSALPPPTSDPSTQTQPPKTEPSKFIRANVPPPLNLKFNFSLDAPSRDPSMCRPALWTPQPLPRSLTAPAPTTDGRPSTSAGPGGGKGGGGLAASPRLISQFPESVPRDDDDVAAFMGIGVARGPSIKVARRPGTAGGRPPASPMVDSFGTGFI